MQAASRQTTPLPFNHLQKAPPIPIFYRIHFHLRRALRHVRHVTIIQFAFFVILCLSVALLQNVYQHLRLYVGGVTKPNSVYELGTARVDITPTEPVWLSGFSSRNRTPSHVKLVDPHIPLYARALCIRRLEDDSPLILVSLDVIAIPRSLSARIYRQAYQQHGLPRASLRLCATHTHSGPVIGEALAPLSPTDGANRARIARYEGHLQQCVQQVIATAMTKRERVKARFARGRAALSVNRREIRETMFDASSPRRGMTDDTVPVLRFERARDGRVIAGVFGYAAHPTILTSGYSYSGDYPAVAAHALESRFTSATWLFLPGAGGDQNIYPRGSPTLLHRHAATLAAAVTATVTAVNMSRDAIAGRLFARHALIDLPFATRYSRLDLRKRAQQGDVQRRAVRVLLPSVANDGFTPSSYAFPVAVWRVGGLTIAFLGGEPTIGYVRLLKNVGIDWVVGYSEDVMGYVGTKDVIRVGGREGGERAAWYYGLPAAWSVRAEDLIVHGVRQLLTDSMLEKPHLQAAS